MLRSTECKALLICTTSSTPQCSPQSMLERAGNERREERVPDMSAYGNATGSPAIKASSSSRPLDATLNLPSVLELKLSLSRMLELWVISSMGAG